jgi:hypothetical protein
MLKTTKKLRLNKEQLRVLSGPDLERAHGGWVNTAGTSWCSSDNLKCTHTCKNFISAECVNK